jgi:hypothetical protein
LAQTCKVGIPIAEPPPSLRWSCENWHALAQRMRSS